MRGLGLGFRVRLLIIVGFSLDRAPKKHISKNEDRDIPSKPPDKGPSDGGPSGLGLRAGHPTVPDSG